MDYKRLIIVFGIVALCTSTFLIVVLSLLVPFAVNDSTSIDRLSGEAEIWSSDQRVRRLSGPEAAGHRLKIGQSLLLLPGSTATVSFKRFNGQLTIRGPATLTLKKASLTTTLLGHLFRQADRFERQMTLVIYQQEGHAYYAFDQSVLSDHEARISVEFPTGTFIPDSACWQVNYSSSGQYLARNTDCQSS